jgi:hypothetical protein
MKNFLSTLPACLFVLLILSERGQAQTTPFWGTSGNNAAPGSFLGTLNNEPLVFKTNGTTQLKIKPDGGLVVKGFDNQGFGFVKFDNNGTLLPVPFNGSANEVLTANGSFQSIQLLSGWKPIPGNHLANVNPGNVGIGVNQPLEKLHVAGNILNDGFLLTKGISIIGTGGRSYPTDALEIQGNSKVFGNSTVSGTISSNKISSTDVLIGSLSSANSGAILTTDANGKVSALGLSNLEALIYTIGPAKTCGSGETMTWKAVLDNMFIDMPVCGRVGIGTNTPQFKLDVIGDAHIAGPLKVGNSSIMIDAPASGTNNIYTTTGSGNLSIQNIANVDQHTIFNSNNKGKIGIGTATPNARLDVVANNPMQYQFAGSFVNNANTVWDSKGVYIATKGNQPGEALQVQNIQNSGTVANLLTVQGSGDASFPGTVAIGDVVDGNAALEVAMPDINGDVFTARFRTATNSMWLKNKVYAGGFGNPIQQTGDQGIFWSDGGGNFGFNSTSGFVIAPYEPNQRGIRIGYNGTIDATDYLINGVSILAGGGASQWTNTTAGISYTTGNVGVGTNNTGSFKFAVDGKAGARDFYVIDSGAWPDYVFSGKYELSELSKVQQYIKKYKHLPGFKTAEEIEKPEGHAVGEIQRLQQEKIEELFLYIIQLKEEIEMLKNKANEK